MTAPKQLTRKVGPLPAWAWAAVVVGAYLAYRRYSGGSGGSPVAQGTPVVPNVGSAAQQPSGGQGTPTDNSSSDLLNALDANTAAADALLSAVQGGSGGGGMGVMGGSASGAGTSASTASATAPTIDSGVNNAPTDPYAAAVASAQSTAPDYGLIAAQIPGSQQAQGFALENAVLANPTTDYTQLDTALAIPSMSTVAAQLQAYGDAIPSPTSTATAPTATVVQPAPVDTTSVYEPRPLAGRTYAA